jgi:hypothetical protein
VNPREVVPIYITEELGERTAQLLDSFASEQPSEGIVYWFGLELEKCSVVTTLIVPEADTRDGCIQTSVEANAEVIRVIVGSPLVLIGQAHSHPGRNVSHSSVDDEQSFARFDGALSVVVPWFGRYGFRIEECGLHRHVGGRFVRVRDSYAHLRIVPGFADLRLKGETNGDKGGRRAKQLE